MSEDLQNIRRVFAKKLEYLMKGREITQKVLAEAIGVTRQAIVQYADGTSLPSVEKFYKISKFFNLSTDYFLDLNYLKNNDFNGVKYRKKPVEVEAFQLLKSCEIPKWFRENKKSYCFINKDNKISAIIDTLEGRMEAYEGDYIVKGINKEIYPVKEDIFLKTYDKI